MFNLSRYFASLSCVLIILVTTGLGGLYLNLSVQQLEKQSEQEGKALGQLFHNSLRAPLDELLTDSTGASEDMARLHGNSPDLLKQVRDLMRDTALFRIRIYNRLGVTVFSTDSDLLGESRTGHPAFRQAMRGQVVSELTRRDQAEGFVGEHKPLDVLASYIPIFGKDHAIEGVFELYQDASPIMLEVRQSLWLVAGGLLTVFALLFLAQYLIVRRAQSILVEQDQRLKHAHDTMELQVEARTEELKRSNRQLEAQIGARSQIESKLNYLAYHDPLTGLANRRAFIERLEAMLAESQTENLQLAVLFIDLDQFKQVNDSLGHGIGDELLVAVANRLSDQVKLIDMLARLGGDEFICLMENFQTASDVALLAREIVASFNEPFRIGPHELYLSAAVGISLFPGDGENAMELLRNADAAMFRAKEGGRGEYQFYTPDMTESVRERVHIERLLRRALESKELSVHLQPQVDQGGRLVGAEALLRWRSAELGEISPVRFIPLAEESGIIVPLGKWVLRETCRQVMHWLHQGFDLPQVSVNLSVRQLERPGFVETLERILEETGMPPSRLKLEITESVVLAVKDARDLLERLRQLGVTLSLDDFGTGYSSLSYLKLLPVEQLKIDRSFVVGIGQNPDDEAIIRSVMALARSLDFEVVAEGVETEAQADFLKSVGCQRLQGWLHGKAVAPAEFHARWATLR